MMNYDIDTASPCTRVMSTPKTPATSHAVGLLFRDDQATGTSIVRVFQTKVLGVCVRASITSRVFVYGVSAGILLIAHETHLSHTDRYVLSISILIFKLVRDC